MGKFSGILLCTDFDGTFALPDARISPVNAAAVRCFQENGGKFTFASGRSPGFFADFPQFHANAPIIAANGTMICDPDTYEIIESYPLTDAILAVIDDIAALPISREMYLCDTHRQSYLWKRGMGAPSEVFSKVQKPWFKVLAHQEIEDTCALRDYVRAKFSGRVDCVRSYPQGLELFMPGAGKGACLERIKALDADIKLTVGVGDFENDVSLIERADVGYAVANAQEECLRAANRITVANTEHAIARIISDIEEGLI